MVRLQRSRWARTGLSHLPLQASLSVDIVAVPSATYEVILAVRSRPLWNRKGIEEPLCGLVLLPLQADTYSARLD
ncbi:hypothetical protein BO78DRAFT_422046 [Aspergillus sclerotiicarbonarius CBS 121057]|uniref:Uncharacterized protein n=1 Tax=Aspergillus sclerotiicarbonarius (strain CBS 121057 / IBT 28362) TaxID=1448318 RepID=A0A319DYY8_ASPSB|nr:hypothetical protein BO78DRAFT_422046 [Aspergillus sclerotiicarbonarius CBS 121057]